MKIKQGKYYGYSKLKNLPWLHYVGLKYSFAHETARENWSSLCFIDSYTFNLKAFKATFL